MIDLDFWRNKNVLVTGHSGFVGGWLVYWLNALRANIVGLSLPPEGSPSFYETCKVSSKMAKSYFQDIREYSKLVEILDTHEFDIVFHLAAQAIVKRGYDDPLTTFETNVAGTVNLLQGLRSQKNLKAVVISTTDKVYAPVSNSRAYQETDKLGGYDPYSASKSCQEIAALCFRKSFFTDTTSNCGIATVRAGNIFGGGDWSDNRIVADFVRAYLSKSPLLIRNPTAVRPWQHVLNPLYGYLLLAERLYNNQSNTSNCINFGPESESHISVERLVSLLAKELPVSLIISDRKQSFSEVEFLKLDSGLAQQTLGWKSVLSLKEGLTLLSQWTKSYKDGQDMEAITQNQIEVFQDIIGS